MVYTGTASPGKWYSTNQEEIYQVFIEVQVITHSEQAGVPRYLKADWLLCVYVMWDANLTSFLLNYILDLRLIRQDGDDKHKFAGLLSLMNLFKTIYLSSLEPSGRNLPTNSHSSYFHLKNNFVFLGFSYTQWTLSSSWNL